MIEKISPNIVNLKKKLDYLKKKGKKIILCHGVFDVLHYGHVLHFEEAKKLGDILVVSVTSDKFVNKGPNRPIFNLETRMRMLSSIKDIDFVIANNNQTPIDLIKNLKPNIYCKGKDYINNSKDLTGNIKKEINAIKSVGGKIHYSVTEMMSSSKIINQTSLNLNPSQQKFINKIKNSNYVNNDDKILSVFESFSNLKVLIVGETIIDQYVFCESLGKSGKEPVLVLRDLYSEKYLGGAAAIANNISDFCASVKIMSCIGQKKEEKNFIQNKLKKNIKTFFLSKKNSPTIIKRRYLDEINKTKVLGVYSINDQPLDKREELIFRNKLIKEIKKHDLVIVSDYGHGLISKNLAKEIIKKSKFLAVNTQVNSSNIGYHVISKYKGANFITVNETELRHELRDKNSKITDLIKKISNNLKCKFVTATCGDEGAFIYNRLTKKINRSPAFANKVVDKVGTGDTMMTLIALSLYKKINMDFAMFISSLAAAENINNFATKKNLIKTNLIKSVQSYLR
jgi:rfaE bifunctional protein kinase chain/domain/rfaE bifunctional protein nucleotidyltransferase chain/domain